MIDTDEREPPYAGPYGLVGYRRMEQYWEAHCLRCDAETVPVLGDARLAVRSFQQRGWLQVPNGWLCAECKVGQDDATCPVCAHPYSVHNRYVWPTCSVDGCQCPDLEIGA